MKKIIATGLFFFLFCAVQAQQPVTWRYESKKLADGSYEIRLKALIGEGWHLYAQQQPQDAIVLPTKVEFQKTNQFVLSGPVKELGNMEKHKDPVLGIESWRYAKEVNFVQRIKLKAGTKSLVNGSITYQVCSDEKCLFPETVNFKIEL